MVAQAEIWLMETPNRKRRPALIVSRREVIPVLNNVVVAPVTSTLRDIPTCLPSVPNTAAVPRATDTSTVVIVYRFAMAASTHRRHRHRPLDRLTEPLVRDGGILRPATWDEALERAAAGFASARIRDGSSIGVFSCSKSTNEMNFVAQKLARVAFGTNNIDSCNRT